MSIRKYPLVTESYYHVFNRTYQFSPFLDQRLANRALLCTWYLNLPHMLTVSSYVASSQEKQMRLLEQLLKQPPKNDILAFCFMPNHFHFLLRQNQDDGISKFVADFQNSLTQYFNTKHKIKGPLFERQFKAIAIEQEEVLLHVARYIHLNPYSANLVRNISELTTYPYSSLQHYLKPSTDPHHTVNIKLIQSLFPDSQKHLDFIADHAAYQKSLHYLATLLLDH